MATLVHHRLESETHRRRPNAETLVRTTPTTDSDLLWQFVHAQRQEAFTELVARHAVMVLGVCKRILRDEHEAEDVFQATFLILANKGRQIQRRHPASVAAWLHRVAYRTALRRAKHRKGKPLVQDVQSPELEQWIAIARQEEQLLLHEELNELPKHYREALVLCCLEGNSCKEAAVELAASPEAIQKRVDRGKRMLRARLARRGVVASGALLALGPAACEAASLPSLVSLTSDICAATVLHADKSIYSTNVGQIARQGATSMNLLNPAAIVAAVLVISAPLFLPASIAGCGDDSSAVDSPPLTLTAEVPVTDRVHLVAQQKGTEPDEDAPELNEKLRIILHRQKGDQLKLYLGDHGAYLNGKSISSSQLPILVRESGLDQAVISAEPYLAKEKVAGWEKTLRDAGVDEVSFTQPKQGASREQTIARILARQKRGQLKIYLKGTRGLYINGRQISTTTLAEIIRQSELDQAAISAGLEVLPQRVAEMEQWLLDHGIEEVEKVGTAGKELTLEEVAAASREQSARAREATLRAVLARQKGDEIKVYLNDRGAYINGKSISVHDIEKIVSASGLDQAVITAEPYVSQDKVADWEKTLRKAGVKTVELSAPKAD